MKKLLPILFILLLCSCLNNSKSSKDKENDCLVGHDWCYPNCEAPNMSWKFSSDGKFNFSTTLFGGNSAWGTWNDLGEQKIQLKYTKTTSGAPVADQVVHMPDCRTLKIGNNLYKR